jgi:hypothetical protein
LNRLLPNQTHFLKKIDHTTECVQQVKTIPRVRKIKGAANGHNAIQTPGRKLSRELFYLVPFEAKVTKSLVFAAEYLQHRR